jgi:hypothetical protein
MCLQAFIKIDASKRGTVTFGEVRKFYNAHKHPKVKSGSLKPLFCQPEIVLIAACSALYGVEL